MSSTQMTHEHATAVPSAATVDLKLEVIVIPVSDVDRAKRFYEKLGFRLDLDAGSEAYRAIHFTPPGSQTSIVFGKGITNAAPGSVDRLLLAVDDIDAARGELLSQGVEVGEVFHDAGGGLGGGFHRDTEGRAAGPDPQRRSYASYASFSDPDGNRWLLQEVKTRLPGRGLSLDLATLTELLRETEEHHGQYEPTAPKHHWSEWYAAYVVARNQGRTPEEAAKDGALRIERTRERVA
jgi:catechol 2,3-dioxygenase-like lactoylglutathione lyase family enzyme